MMLVLLYGYEKKKMLNGLYVYENKEFFHGHINTETIPKFPDKLIGKRAPPREQLQQYHNVQQRIASLHLAETLRPTALPHDSALHL